MLVLSRLVGETVVVGSPEDPIGTVTVMDIRGDKVRLGLDFPRAIDVHRGEVAAEIVIERRQKLAAEVAGPAVDARLAGEAATL